MEERVYGEGGTYVFAGGVGCLDAVFDGGEVFEELFCLLGVDFSHVGVGGIGHCCVLVEL